MHELQDRSDSKLDMVQRIVQSASEPMEQRQHIKEARSAHTTCRSVK